MAAAQVVPSLLEDPEMKVQDNSLVHYTSWDWASKRLNLPILGITEVLGVGHRLSNSDLYPRCVCVWERENVKILVKLSLLLNRCQWKSDMSKICFPMFPRNWLICWSASWGFVNTLCDSEYIYLASVKHCRGFLMTDLELWVDLWICHKGCLH